MIAQPTCPYYNSSLEASPPKTVRIHYRYDKTTRGEIKEGMLICKSCGNKFVIKHFIPSFLQSELVDNEPLGEGTFWGQYYSFLNNKGIANCIAN